MWTLKLKQGTNNSSEYTNFIVAWKLTVNCLFIYYIIWKENIPRLRGTRRRQKCKSNVLFRQVGYWAFFTENYADIIFTYDGAKPERSEHNITFQWRLIPTKLTLIFSLISLLQNKRAQTMTAVIWVRQVGRICACLEFVYLSISEWLT